MFCSLGWFLNLYEVRLLAVGLSFTLVSCLLPGSRLYPNQITFIPSSITNFVPLSNPSIDLSKQYITTGYLFFTLKALPPNFLEWNSLKTGQNSLEAVVKKIPLLEFSEVNVSLKVRMGSQFIRSLSVSCRSLLTPVGCFLPGPRLPEPDYPYTVEHREFRTFPSWTRVLISPSNIYPLVVYFLR